MAWTRLTDTKAISANGAAAPATLTELPLGSNQFQAKVTSGTGSIVVAVQVSNDNASWETAMSFSMNGAGTGTQLQDFGTIVNSWRYFQYLASGVSGTVTVTMYLSGG